MSFQTISAEAEHTATAAADYPEDGDTHEGKFSGIRRVAGLFTYVPT
jgi:hypothetical protein